MVEKFTKIEAVMTPMMQIPVRFSSNRIRQGDLSRFIRRNFIN